MRRADRGPWRCSRRERLGLVTEPIDQDDQPVGDEVYLDLVDGR